MGILLTFFGGLVLTVGDIVMKKWLVNNNWYIFLCGLLFYFIGCIFVAFSFKYANIAIASLLLILFNIISLLIVSYFYFGEKLNAIQIFAMILGLIAAIILEYSGE